ncbi:hypothetical protein SAMN04489712_119139 [Thermomonospora echinospora]|uniref:Uncharacterized protein n=1 Tax=Thermomonospora echinospora TaxID=1992 RepID=A0A1H6DMS5_9ACTN|nr:hypothetical protein [Thermomonospora echinospora]SEG86657.1 hypothetical protein SAMN04489712_119139 [Thermomonospora echinospora]
MRKPVHGGTVIAAAATAVIGLTALPALAATWTVTGSVGPYRAVSVNTKLTKGFYTFSCIPFAAGASVTLNGSLPNGTGLTSPIGNVTSSAWLGCSGPVGLVTISHTGAWLINPASQSGGPTSPVTGSISNIGFTIAGSGCTATITGSVNFIYNNAGTLQLTGGTGLTVTSASCGSYLVVNDQPVLTGSFAVTPNTIRIKTP